MSSFVNIQVGVGSAPFTFPMDIDLELKPSQIIQRALKIANENPLQQLEANSSHRQQDVNNKFRVRLSGASDPLDNYKTLRTNNVRGYIPQAGEIAVNGTFSKASTLEVYDPNDLTWNPTKNIIASQTVLG